MAGRRAQCALHHEPRDHANLPQQAGKPSIRVTPSTDGSELQTYGALEHGVDREQIVETAWVSMAEPGDCLLPRALIDPLGLLTGTSMQSLEAVHRTPIDQPREKP